MVSQASEHSNSSDFQLLVDPTCSWVIMRFLRLPTNVLVELAEEIRSHISKHIFLNLFDSYFHPFLTLWTLQPCHPRSL